MARLEIGNRAFDTIRNISHAIAVYEKNADTEPTDCTAVTVGESDVGLVVRAV